MKKILKTILTTAFLLTSFSIASADTYTIDGKANNVHDFVGKVYVIVNFRLDGDDIKASVKVDPSISACFNGSKGDNTYSVQKIARFLSTATTTTMVTLLGEQPWAASINNEYTIDTNKEMSTTTCPVATTTATTSSTTTNTAMLLKTQQYSRFAVVVGDRFTSEALCKASGCLTLPNTICMPAIGDNGYNCALSSVAPAPTTPTTPAPVATTDPNMCQRGNMLLLHIKGRSKDRARDGLLMDYFDKTLYIPYGHLLKPRVSISFDN
jgi:hypothetical protein